MKITIESYDHVYTVETPNDDLNIYDVGEIIKSLLVSVGFHPNSVSEIFKEER